MKQLCLITSVAVWMLADCINLNFQMTDLEGRWKSAAPEKIASGYFSIREFTFHKRSWEVMSTIYLDSLLQDPVFTFRAIGKFEIQDPAKLPGTQNALFMFNRKYLTARTKDSALLIKAGISACTLPFAREIDITETGCSYLVAKTTCAQEYDLICLKADTLFLGARPAAGGMCSKDKRPVSLGQPLKKIKH